MAPKKGIQPIEGQIPVTLDRAAALCGVTEKTIRSWINDGLPYLQEGKRGRSGVKTIVDLVEVMRWFLEQDALDAAKTRLASAQADKHEMENAVRRGELADVNDVARAWGELVMACRAKLLSLPMKLAPQLTNVADPAILASRLRADVEIALGELADGDQGRGGSGRGSARRTKPVPAASESDGERVGGRKSKAQQRIIG